jgi:hypothetical protein
MAENRVLIEDVLHLSQFDPLNQRLPQ